MVEMEDHVDGMCMGVTICAYLSECTWAIVETVLGMPTWSLARKGV